MWLSYRLELFFNLMRPKTVWLYELLDTWKACGGKRGMFRPWHKKYECKMKYSPEPAEANTILCLEIFYAEARRISLRHTLRYGKQLIPDPLVIGTHWLKWLPRMKAHENINLCRPCCGGDGVEHWKKTVAAPIKKKCAAMTEICKTRHCDTVLFGGCCSSGEWGGGRKSPYPAMRPGTRTGGIKSYGAGSVPDAIP